MDKIILKDLCFEGIHGVYKEERLSPQPFIVTLTLSVDLSVVGQSDDLLDTLDYDDIYELTRQVVEERSFNLIEAMAEAIAQEILNYDGAGRIISIEVEVTKPAVSFAPCIYISRPKGRS